MSYRHTHHKGLRRGKPKFESSSDEDEERFIRFSQVVIPVEEERTRTAGLPVRWSSVDKEEAVKLSEDLLTASCHCGYRAVRASHGISEGCWFFELEIGGVAKDGEGGHCRVGWAMDRVAFEDLEAPIGYSPDMDEPDSDGEGSRRSSAGQLRYGMSFSYGSKSGAAYTRSRPIQFGEPYSAGDVVGCLIELTKVPPSPVEPRILNEGTRFHCPLWVHYWVQKKLEKSRGAHISFFKNGVLQGQAFHDVWCGTYYPAASFYYGGSARANFGPTFRFPPTSPSGERVKTEGGVEGYSYRPMSEAASELQVWEKVDDWKTDKSPCMSETVSRSRTPPVSSSSPAPERGEGSGKRRAKKEKAVSRDAAATGGSGAKDSKDKDVSGSASKRSLKKKKVEADGDTPGPFRKMSEAQRRLQEQMLAQFAKQGVERASQAPAQ